MAPPQADGSVSADGSTLAALPTKPSAKIPKPKERQIFVIGQPLEDPLASPGTPKTQRIDAAREFGTKFFSQYGVVRPLPAIQQLTVVRSRWFLSSFPTNQMRNVRCSR